MATAEEVELRVNLNTLKKTDTEIDQILDSAVQVALYYWKAGENRWEKPEVEGTLFVYSRKTAPHYGFTIMNRLAIDNLSEKITPNMNVHINAPFLLYQSKTEQHSPRGIWFYSQYDCSRISALVQKLQKESIQQQRVSPVPVKEPQPEEPVDIMGMLNKSFKKAQTKVAPKSESPINSLLNGNVKGLRISPVQQTPGKKVDLNTLFNTFTPIKPASPVQHLAPPSATPPGTTPIDLTKTAALRNIMGLDHINKPPWPEANRQMLSSSDSSDERLIQPTTLPESLAYEMKQMTMLETPPPGTVAIQRKSDSESDILNNQNSFAILDSLEEAGSSDAGINHKGIMQSPIGRPSDKIAKTISRNLFGTQRKNSAIGTELLSPADFATTRPSRSSFSSTNGAIGNERKSSTISDNSSSINKEVLKSTIIRLLEEDSDFLNRIHQAYQASISAKIDALC